MGKLIPILLALIGLAAGGGAGYFLRPPRKTKPPLMFAPNFPRSPISLRISPKASPPSNMSS